MAIEPALPGRQRRGQDHERDTADADRNLHDKPPIELSQNDMGEKRQQNTETIDQ